MQLKFRAIVKGEYKYSEKVGLPDFFQMTEMCGATVQVWTGVRDKNGTEVYEGDRLDFDEQEWGCDFVLGEVSWDKNKACWDFFGGDVADVSQWRQVVNG